MAYKHTPWVYEACGLTPTEKLVLFALTMPANNQTLQTFVSISTIAKKCGYSPNSRNTVRKALQSLREKGFISYKERARKDGKGQDSNLYTIHYSDPEEGGSSQHRGWVSTAPGVGPDSTTNEEPNEEPNEELLFTSDSDESDQQEKLARPILTNPTRAAADDGLERSARAAAADPVSPEFYISEDRQILIGNIQQLAETHVSHGGGGPEYANAFDTFESNLVTAFNEDDLLDYLLGDRNWMPTKIHADKYQASVWLNKLLHTWTNETGPLTWRGQNP